MCTLGFFCSVLSCELFCDYSKLLHSPFNCKYLQAGLWQLRNAQQEVESPVSSKRHSLGWCKGDNRSGYGEDVMTEGHTMSTLAGSALTCSQEHGTGFEVMLPGGDCFISKRQTTGTAFCMMPGDNSSLWYGEGQDCAASDSLGRLLPFAAFPWQGTSLTQGDRGREQAWGYAAFFLLLKQPGFEFFLCPASCFMSCGPAPITALSTGGHRTSECSHTWAGSLFLQTFSLHSFPPPDHAESPWPCYRDLELAHQPLALCHWLSNHCPNTLQSRWNGGLQGSA